MNTFTQISWVLSLMFLVCSAEMHPNFIHENQMHDVKYLVEKTVLHFQNSHRLGSQPVHLHFEPIKSVLDNSTKCFRDLIYFVQSLTETSGRWALKMLDSFGKPDSGLLEGNLKWIGEYTECTQISVPPTNDSTAGNFHGLYCFLELNLPLPNLNVTVITAVCLPDSCSGSEIPLEFLNLLLPSVAKSVKNLTCKPTKDSLNTPGRAVIAMMSVFGVLVILGSSITAIKYFLKKSDDEIVLLPAISSGISKKCELFLKCFCIFRNGAKLLNTTAGEGELLCIHGIRFLSMSWVMLGHIFSFCIPNTRNMYETINLTKNLAFQIILQGVFAVDSFFVLSGLLLTYLSMREFAKNRGGINWPYFYIHRYIRLTPVYMIVLGFYSTVFLYLSSGPFSPDYDVDPVCRNHWWWNLLYINNFAAQANQCMGWSWYLANDMQFFVISPLFLISLWRWPKVGYGLVAVFLCSCWLSNFILTYQYDLLAGVAYMLNYPVEEIKIMIIKYNDFFQLIYVKPYARIGPYLIGVLTGYILFLRKKSKNPKHSWITLSVGWVFASITTLLSIYGLYQGDPSLVARSFYNALSCTTFAIGLCWVIYICLVDQGGFVNSLLSIKMFIPLSRLTYAAYLVHPLIIHGYFNSLKRSFEYSHPTLVILFLGVIMATYAISLPVALVFESPIIALEKLIRTSFKKGERAVHE